MEVEETNEALHKAIVDHAVASGFAGEDEILSEWAIISNWQPLEAGTGESRYVTLFTTPTAPMHVAAGLFEVGGRVIWEESDEA